MEIPVKEFALAIVLENGEEKVYSSSVNYRDKCFGAIFKHGFYCNCRNDAQEASGPNHS